MKMVHIELDNAIISNQDVFTEWIIELPAVMMKYVQELYHQCGGGEGRFVLSQGDKEIDFVCDKQGDKLYVQVSYLLASDETVNREFGAYNNIRDNFPKYVVSLDEFDMSRNGIKHRNIRDFLLAEEWN